LAVKAKGLIFGCSDRKHLCPVLAARNQRK
jgi:hypothetical protein